VLDFVVGDLKDLGGRLGPADRRKVDEYLTGVREVERRLAVARPAATDGVAMARPNGIPQDFGEHARLLGDLTALAFRADLTRVATFALGNDGGSIGCTSSSSPISCVG
jgi:hypothetical protein